MATVTFYIYAENTALAGKLSAVNRGDDTLAYSFDDEDRGEILADIKREEMILKDWSPSWCTNTFNRTCARTIVDYLKMYL